jgi:hypothetical protein
MKISDEEVERLVQEVEKLRAPHRGESVRSRLERVIKTEPKYSSLSRDHLDKITVQVGMATLKKFASGQFRRAEGGIRIPPRSPRHNEHPVDKRERQNEEIAETFRKQA